MDRLLAGCAVFAIFSVTAQAVEPKITDEEKAVRKVLEDQVTAWNQGDLDAFMKGYWNSEDLTFYSGKDKRQGWKETMERYRKRYQGKGKEMGKLQFNGLELTPMGADHMLVKGAFEVQMTNERLQGLFTLILKKTPDGWRIIHDHTSG